MNGYYDFKNNTFQCSPETKKFCGKVIVYYEGTLLLDRIDPHDFLHKLANDFEDFELLRELNGQFSIVIVNTEKSNVFLIRDQFGITPLYYAFRNDTVVFSSNIELILHSLEENVSINQSIVHEYFSYRYVSGKETFFNDIYEVKPSSVVEFNKSERPIIHDYHVFQYSEKKNEKEKSYSTLFTDAFWHSLNLQTLDKDNNTIGVLSSGGIDSSILVSCARKILGPHFRTYYVGYNEYKHNRTYEVDYLSKLYDTTHKSVFISNKEFADGLIDTIIINEEPLNHPSSVARKLLYEAISGEINVLLSGEGADCLYCGYYIFNLFYYFYMKNPLSSLSRKLAHLLPAHLLNKNKYSKLSKVFNSFVLSPAEYTVSCADLTSASTEQVGHLLSREFPDDFLHNYKSLLSGCTKNSVLNTILHIYQTYYLVEALNTITKLGRNSGIEHRHPFIDANMVALFNQFPWKEKLGFFKRKRQVVELGKRYLPKEFFSKPKEGFGVPLYAWFYNENGLGRYVGLLKDKRTRERDIYNTKYVDELFDTYWERKLPAECFESILWPIINLELWYRIFIDKDISGYR